MYRKGVNEKVIFDRHKYKFTDKHNTKGGIAATLLGIIAVTCIIWSVNTAFRSRGTAGAWMGTIATLGFGCSTLGLILGLSSFKEEDKFYFFSWVGTIICAIVWICNCTVIAVGLF